MIEAVIFDVFGTVVDWRSGVAACVSKTGLDVDPVAFADAWRARYQPKMDEVRTGGRSYVPLDVLHRENLEDTLHAFGVSGVLSETSVADLNRAWEKLPPWPDSVPSLTRLKSAYIIAPNSNGSIALMARLSRFGGLPWDAILGADIAKDYKPAPQVYLACAAALDLRPEEVMMVAAHNGDLAAARSCGLATGFFPRPTEHGPGQTSDLEPTADWDIVARDLDDLAQKLVK